MIKSFEIKNFRLFDNLKVNRLERVNLVVGKNNAGKSAFLEAVQLFQSKFSLKAISDIAGLRVEDNAKNIESFWYNFPETIKHFFPGHEFPHLNEGFSFSDKKTGVKAVYAAYEWRPNEARIFVDEKTENIREECLRVFYEDKEIVWGFSPGVGPFPRRKEIDEIKIHHIPPSGISDEDAVSLFLDAILDDTAMDSILTGLRLLEPAVEKISFKNDDSLNRFPVVKLSSFRDPVPLKSLGDGMTRILHIVLSLVSCKKGDILTIDELENGLYWNTQPKVWKMIFELAKKLDVQVFATTHSRDCVAGFYEAWKENEPDGAFLRLMRGEGQPPVQEYNLQLLQGSLESAIEVR